MPCRPTFLDVADDDTDGLISVEELALRWRTPVNAIVPLVVDRTIPSLDGGHLAGRGRLDVPVLRPSWAEATRVDSPGAARRLDLDLGEHLHRAASTALALHEALADRSAASVWKLSSQASREEAGNPTQLVDLWLAALGDVFNERTGIATGVYALVPHRGVGVRIVGGIGPMPVRYEHPTPQMPIGTIVVVPEDGDWRADVILTGADIDYVSLVRSAPPDDWSRDDGALP